jgi:hypothetical protein
VTTAWIAVLLLAVGLPLLFWWWGSRGFWAHRDEQGRRYVDLRQEMRRRHALTRAEATLVEDAVQRGGELDDERLRAATVEWAGRVLGDMRRSGLLSGMRGLPVVFWGLYAVGGVAVLVSDVVMGDGVPWMPVLFIVNGLVGAAGPLMARRTVRRAIERNSGPSVREQG